MELIDMNDIITLASPYSCIQPECLQELYDLVAGIQVPGAVVECGVANGGTAAVIWSAAGKERDLWLFDSFEGLPRPTVPDGGRAFSKYDYHIATHGSWCKGYSKHVEHIVGQVGDLDKVKIIPGWIENTLPEYAAQIGKIAVLHIDVDFYEPTRCALEWLHHLVVEGGLVVVDDYSYWPGCKTAVDEYLGGRGLTLMPMLGAPVYWRVG
jgi:hypothetical protein